MEFVITPFKINSNVKIHKTLACIANLSNSESKGIISWLTNFMVVKPEAATPLISNPAIEHDREPV
jgi:hypothetical protein